MSYFCTVHIQYRLSPRHSVTNHCDRHVTLLGDTIRDLFNLFIFLCILGDRKLHSKIQMQKKLWRYIQTWFIYNKQLWVNRCNYSKHLTWQLPFLCMYHIVKWNYKIKQNLNWSLIKIPWNNIWYIGVTCPPFPLYLLHLFTLKSDIRRLSISCNTYVPYSFTEF